MSKKKYAVWVVAGIAVLVGIIVFCVLAFGGNAKAKELEELLSLANRYLQELDYENAVAAFQSALEIEPKSEEAYLGLADAYVGLGDYEAALQALTEGIEKTQSDALREKLSEVEALAGISGADGASGGGGSVGVLNGAGGGAAPDGEEQEPEHNAYGATVFEKRWDYREFSELTAQEQELVETCVNAAVAHEGGLLDVLAGKLDLYLDTLSDVSSLYLLTKYGEYKVSVDLVQMTQTTFQEYSGHENIPFESTSFTVCVEVRPESGTGYIYFKDVFEGQYYGSGSYYQDGVIKTTSWLECPCTDWQWNGSISREDYYEEVSSMVWIGGEAPPDGLESEECNDITTFSGSASMGLLQGDYVEVTQFDRIYRHKGVSEPEYYNETFTNTVSYADGWTQYGDTWALAGADGSEYYAGERIEDITSLPEDVLDPIFW